MSLLMTYAHTPARTKIWLVLAALFALVNIIGIPLAAMAGEVLHCALHVVLALLGAWMVWRLTVRHASRS